MRQDHRPYLIKKLSGQLNRLYTERFLFPHFDHVGVGARVTNPRYFDVHGPRIRLGDHIHMMATRDNQVRFSVWTDGERSGSISLGDYSIILPGARISSACGVVLGKNCMMASNSYITDADWHDIYNRSSAPGGSGSVVLEDNVWLGDSVIVTKGVRIGCNSVAGAGAVVADDVPPNVVVAGNPARVVKELDPDRDFVTRATLFEGAVPYENFIDAFDREVLGENTVGRWIQSMILPGRDS
jgi:acetyltransferase-like isoleucine patch superfamily enzyme